MAQSDALSCKIDSYEDAHTHVTIAFHSPPSRVSARTRDHQSVSVPYPSVTPSMGAGVGTHTLGPEALKLGFVLARVLLIHGTVLPGQATTERV
jgi:hypothetical protein